MTFKRVIIGVLALAVLGAGVLFVLDQTLFAPAPVSSNAPVAPTLAIPTQTQPDAAGDSTQDPAQANTAGMQLYRIDAAQSEVRYEVGETLFNQNNRFNLAVGRTQGIAGDVLVDFTQPSNSQLGEIVIDVSQFTSDENRRDNFIRRTGLESSRYPQAHFVTRAIEGLPAQVAVGDQVTFSISGDLTVKETTRPVTWNITMTMEDTRLVGSASTEITMSDFGVGPIRLPILETEDLVKLFFDFVAMPVEG
ncbi:MAG TPA: YceI family protein [Anaerolineae bacterium]|nr:YceI family protein [Anaerolineae bacterium]